ncbi:probable lysophospholipase BODYGUARD 4 [Olea europaea var. sylvestris]|uniref:probable lysophospholipase BODYGUARD 4 n=1 Tax=Olea europaea var. sylvestris TaxID=158386 RepID=UPI000C1D2E1B|nr:probable lysophospholipase BODYGUARD 4 [Olea europaea var. sylvestris]
MEMPRISSVFSTIWLQKIAEFFISITSAIIFFFLDFLDFVMCIFFRFLDEFLEGKPSSCYCKVEQDKRAEILEIDEESELSETFHGRKNVFREMGFLRIPRMRKDDGKFCAEKRNSWSDCGCESCVSWMNNGSNLKLHVVVKEPERARLEHYPEEKAIENVIFIHGFLSSSSFWTETVFTNLSEHTKQNYRLFAIDLLGFGKSPKPRDCMYTLRDHLQMIEKSVIDPFQLNSFHVVAHSMGCVIAVALAAKYSESVKSITLVAPPYFSSSKEDASLAALRQLAARRIWPPLLFGSALMSWYEHLGRCVCFLFCRNHKTWEQILKLLTRRRDLPFKVVDFTRHTHHSAWHTMHNIICGGAKLLDKYLDTLKSSGVKIHIVQGNKDQVVPLECSYNMKMRAPYAELSIIPNADHNTVIFGREEFTRNLEKFLESTDNRIAD